MKIRNKVFSRMMRQIEGIYGVHQDVKISSHPKRQRRKPYYTTAEIARELNITNDQLNWTLIVWGIIFPNEGTYKVGMTYGRENWTYGARQMGDPLVGWTKKGRKGIIELINDCKTLINNDIEF